MKVRGIGRQRGNVLFEDKLASPSGSQQLKKKV